MIYSAKEETDAQSSKKVGPERDVESTDTQRSGYWIFNAACDSGQD
jgi:hypothetical protein